MKQAVTAEVVQGFVNACLIHKFEEATASPPFHMDLWELCCSSHKFVALAAPRGHSKSSAVTFAYTLAMMLFRQRSFELIVASTEAQSALFLSDIKNELLDNEHIHNFFGKITAIKDNETDFIGQFEDGQQFRIMAKSSGQKLRGLKWDNRRPDLIVIDDLEDDEAVINKEIRSKLKNWFNSALLPCMAPKGIVRMVGTVLHMDSLLENKLPFRKEKGVIETPLAQIRTKPHLGWMSIRWRAHSSDFKHILWPDRFSKQHWIETRRNYVGDGLGDKYSQEFLNYPIDEDDAYFKKMDLQEMTDSDFDQMESGAKPLRYYAACDLAISEKQKADFTVMMVAATDENNTLYFVDMIRGRFNSKEIIEHIIDIQRQYQPDMFTIETGAIEKSIGPFLREEMYHTGVFVNINKMTPDRDKISRSRSLQARMKAGKVKFNQTADWYPDLEDEFLKFPRAAHDDIVDACAWMGLTLDRINEAPTREELEEEWYQEEVRETGNNSSGRSKITGY